MEGKTNGERIVPKMEGKTNFSRHLKQFDSLTWLTLTPIFYNSSTPLSAAVCLFCGICAPKRRFFLPQEKMWVPSPSARGKTVSDIS